MFKTKTVYLNSDKLDSNLCIKEAAKALVAGKRTSGSGAFATVYVDDKWAYKVGMCQTDNPWDDAYLTYVKVLSKQKKHNKFTPKIKAVTIFKDSIGDLDPWYVVQLEKLKPIKGAVMRRKYRNAVSWIEAVVEDDSLDSFVSNDEAILGVKMIIPTALRDALDIVIKAFIKGGEYDLHMGNFMLRGDQLVITDPLC